MIVMREVLSSFFFFFFYSILLCSENKYAAERRNLIELSSSDLWRRGEEYMSFQTNEKCKLSVK
jgi:hypothetical protein